jgi:starch-binding outer membrane protein, SusD/RagB family
MKIKNIIKLLVFLPLLTSCDDLFTPAIENIRGIDAMYKEPSYAQGILANAYILLPYSSTPNSDVATDDAVTNDKTSTYLKMATGSWASNSDPMSQWQARRNAIQYINLFLERTDSVTWANNSVISSMFNDRLKGEAYGLRALQLFYLLQAHGGWVNGKLLGVPILTHSETSTSDFNVERNTFQDCIDSIIADASRAKALLPLNYNDIATANIPAKYVAMGITNASDYNRVFGAVVRGRMCGNIADAIVAQATLLAASPAYNTGTTITWADAADKAATVLDNIGGVSGLASTGTTWYTNSTEITAAQKDAGSNPKEIIWRGDVESSNDLESSNFPPSLEGTGRINPTQNLVDAFPMANGYPISDETNSGYNASDPYTNRDPRLANYIVVNGSTQGPSSTTITTGTYGSNYDVINKESGYSTRTGYYLRKLLRSDCNVTSASSTKQLHYTARIRYTEIFLDYAEAANEAWGPTGKGTHAYSAYDVIKAIRTRAGVGVNNGDPYLENIKNSSDKDAMRELIRNERRLELCFENHRFYDLRRWKVDLTKLNETATGEQIDKLSDGSLEYSKIDVETRNYEDYMYYGPIPYSETLKWKNLYQNDGWK